MADPAAFLDLLARAELRSAAGDWAEAAGLWARVTGSRPNFTGETIPFELPYSKLRANVGDLFWQTSWPEDHRTWIAPDIYAPPTFEAFRRNDDPAMDAILALREHLPGR